MTKRKPPLDKPASLQGHMGSPDETGTSVQDLRTWTWMKVWDIFWDDFSRREKWVILSSILGVLVPLVAGIWCLGYLVGDKLSEGTVKALTAQIQLLDRQLADKKRESERTIETAKPANRNYEDFLKDLSITAQGHGHLQRMRSFR